MKAVEAQRLFGRNASSYDPVNRAISLGLDRRWREWVVRSAVTSRDAKVLDAMAGTGEVAVGIARRGASVTAVDVSPEMLAVARRRARSAGVDLDIMLADVTDPDTSLGDRYDAAVVSFGLRYLDSPTEFLRRIAGCIKPDGRIVVLEFCLPRRTPLSVLAGFYFFRVLPRIAALLGEGPELYEYLRDSVRALGTAEQIVALVEAAGLEVRLRRTMGFGLVLGLVAEPVAARARRT